MLKKYIVKRLIYAIPVLWGVITIAFILSRMMPGDPVLLYLHPPFTEQEYQQMRDTLGLNQPLIVQYFNYIWDVLHLNLGKSIQIDRGVLDLILQYFPPSLVLGVFGIFLAILISIPLGIYCALHHNTPIDYGGTLFAIFFVSMPYFWLGIMLILLFSVGLGLFPAGGRGVPPDFQHLVLPGLTIGLTYAAANMRLTRSSMLEAMGQDFVRTARAKGCSKRRVTYHGLRNALLPVVTNMSLQLAHVIGGLVVIEVVFSYQGFGKLTYDSILTRDYPVLQGCILMMGFIFVFINLVVDLLYTVIDPRIKYED